MRIGLFAILLTVFCSVPSASAADLKVGFVDMQKALASSKTGVAAQKQYETEVKEAQLKLDVKKSEYEKLQQEFSKKKDSLNDKARAQREEELISMEKELKRSFQDTQDVLRRRHSQLVGDLVKKIKVVVEEVGKAEGYTVIIEKNSPSILFTDGETDISEEVVEKFNKSAK